MKYKITRIKQDDVIAGDSMTMNTNNHWENKERPNDYDVILNSQHTESWIGAFHPYYQVICLDRGDLYWMIKASKSGMIRQKFPNAYREELTDTVTKLMSQIPPEVFDGSKKYFVRANNISLKYGIHGAGPYCDLKSILESMVTSTYAHQPFHDDDTLCKIYLLPWIEMDHEREFRIFVYEGKITAISQQYLHQINYWLSQKTEAELEDLLDQIIIFHQKKIHPLISDKCGENYVMDFAVLDVSGSNSARRIQTTDRSFFYFIETNSFGKEYASGSALFHWLNDEQILYGMEDIVELRFTV